MSRRAALRDVRRGGFTFIELLVVVSIMAVITTIGVGMSRWIAPESELTATARDLASAIEDARNEAVLSGRRVWVELDLGNNGNSDQYYRSIREPEPGHEKDVNRDEVVLTVRDWVLFPHNVRVESIFVGDNDPVRSGNTSIPIEPNGTLQSQLIRLHAPDFGNNAGWCCIRVAGLLGEAQVVTHYLEPEFLKDESF